MGGWEVKNFKLTRDNLKTAQAENDKMGEVVLELRATSVSKVQNNKQILLQVPMIV